MTEQTMFPGVAVVTGAAGTGMGAAIAKAFAKEGCKKIAITDINDKLLEATRAAIVEAHPDVKVYVEAGDIANSSFTSKFMENVVQTFQRIDYAVNCAGVMSNGQPSTETSLEDFDKITNINYRGCWLSSRAELSHMLKQEPLPSHDSRRPAQRGSIVNIASQLGIVGRPSAPAYCASKSAVIGMTRADAIDFSKYNIRVNAICPGLIDTPMTSGRMDYLKSAVSIAPMDRMGMVDEVADCVLFLCSTRASFVQGHAMVVDGGYIIN